ncbi:hypothetical protein ACFFLS_14335 [Flavobacterium procerum]|uniref:Uncharacterized protein n=1 Tax=Flavobacterium procerum TaxID=1455569 RepID=A0ABV6BS11_9FLAO
MLKVNSPLFKLIVILFRQMNLSIARYSNKEDFFVYFEDKRKYYKYTILQLELLLFEGKPYSSFFDMVWKCFFIRRVSKLNIIFMLKFLKEFDDFLENKNLDYIFKERMNIIASGEIYWGLLRTKLARKERKIIDQTEHFGQNLAFSNYGSIDETLTKLRIHLEI